MQCSSFSSFYYTFLKWSSCLWPIPYFLPVSYPRYLMFLLTPFWAYINVTLFSSPPRSYQLIPAASLHPSGPLQHWYPPSGGISIWDPVPPRSSAASLCSSWAYMIVKSSFCWGSLSPWQPCSLSLNPLLELTGTFPWMEFSFQPFLLSFSDSVSPSDWAISLKPYCVTANSLAWVLLA